MRPRRKMKGNVLKLSTKLFGSFGLLLVLLACLGGFVQWEMGSMNKDTTDLATNWLPSVVADEVRKLAEKTMVATKDVGDAIRSIQEGARKNNHNVEQAVSELAGQAQVLRSLLDELHAEGQG